MKNSRTLGAVVRVTVWLTVLAPASVNSFPQATPEETISGTIAATKIITQNARLTGNVTCTVEGAPCIQIGASGVTLDLNGFTMTGLADPEAGCNGGGTGGEVGINVVGQSDVTIQGPGLVQQFRNQGINLAAGSQRIRVVHVTASTNCFSGILVASTSDSHLEGNVLVRNGNLAAPCGGICITGASQRNRILRNEVSGNGYVMATTNFGIGVIAAGSTDNVIEENIVTGNVRGIRVVATTIQNVFRKNFVSGNPPIQVANSLPDNSNVDILNLSPTGANTFENNFCITSINAPCAILRPTADVIPIVTGVVFDPANVRTGGSFNATFSGSNLTNATYFDVRFRAPDASSDAVALDWQQGPSASHTVRQGTSLGNWTITGVRAHRDANDHTGPFLPVQATLSVFLSPF